MMAAMKWLVEGLRAGVNPAARGDV